MSVDTITYETGRNLQAGKVSTDQLPLVADTYYPGMLLEYNAAVAITQTGTGDGTLTAVIAGDKVPEDVYTLTFTAPLVCDLTNAAGDVLAQGLTIADGGARTFTVEGLTFTITDGAAAFVAADTLVATLSAGAYKALVTDTNIGAIFNAAEVTLSGAGYGDCIVGGDIDPTGLVSNANVTLVLTEDQRAIYGDNGFYIKRV